MGLGHRQREVLEKLHRRGPMTSSELARSMDLDRTVVFRLTKVLEGHGLIRCAGTKDVRGKAAILWEAVERP